MLFYHNEQAIASERRVSRAGPMPMVYRPERPVEGVSGRAGHWVWSRFPAPNSTSLLTLSQMP